MSTLTPTGLPAFFKGTITDERNQDKEGWLRRSIGVPKSGAYPQPGDSITIIDIDGDKYQLRFTKSRNRVKVCLGQPGILKNWYTKHYSGNVVANDNVYFVFNGCDHEYLIYSSEEWAKRNTDKARKQPQ